MKYFYIFCIFILSTFCLSPAAVAEESSPSGSPYDSVIEIGKNTISLIDSTIDSGTEVNKHMADKLAQLLQNSNRWKNLSAQSQSFLGEYISKLGPWVKKLGWIINAVDLLPSLYNTGLSFWQRNKPQFIEAFRESSLKVTSIVTGLAVGAAVTAALPLVVPLVGVTGVGAVVLTAGGALVTVGVSMLTDYIIKSKFSKNIEAFASSIYESLIGDSTFSSILGGGGSPGGTSSRGGVKLDALQW